MRCRDTGAGITPEALEHIFEPFVQFDNAMHRSDSGLGMGLALVKRLAELHGGTVTAESDGPGRGSEFTVRLPLLAPEDVRPSQPTAEITATLPSEDALRVLVVDDNLDYAEGIAILLRAAGHSVSLAHHGEAGLLAAMREPPPDIILLDLGLPGLDGYAVAQRLRSPEIAARMKGATIVAVSGFSPKNAPKGRPNFFDAQLVKPIAHADLLGLLQEKLAARKAAVSPLASHRILLIEDNQEIALLTAELLRNRGLHVEVAFDGADGIEKAGSFRPHAILCDLHLPDMTGFDVAQRLRAASELARKEDASLSPPLLVAVTAFSADPLPARVDRGPFDHFMSKPLDWAELNRLLSSSEKKSMAVAP